MYFSMFSAALAIAGAVLMCGKDFDRKWNMEI